MKLIKSLLAVTGLTALAGCLEDDARIAQQFDFGNYSPTFFNADGGIPVVIHNSPSANMDANQIVPLLHVPNGFRADMVWNYLPPGTRSNAVRQHVVLVFNWSDTPDPSRACVANSTLPSKGYYQEGYTAFMVVCRGSTPLKGANMVVNEIDPNNPDDINRTMKHLILNLKLDRESK
ncbi:hypothetical protein ACMA5I_12315 [Paracoccaceae bacterium GXU_MW_L88]